MLLIPWIYDLTISLKNARIINIQMKIKGEFIMDNQLEIIKRKAVQIFSEEELDKKIKVVKN